jgi:hypothetical protein
MKAFINESMQEFMKEFIKEFIKEFEYIIMELKFIDFDFMTY